MIPTTFPELATHIVKDVSESLISTYYTITFFQINSYFTFLVNSVAIYSNELGINFTSGDIVIMPFNFDCCEIG